MRNKCLLGLGLVFVISLTSMVAFAFSFTGTPADEVDETEMIVRAVFSLFLFYSPCFSGKMILMAKKPFCVSVVRVPLYFCTMRRSTFSS